MSETKQCGVCHGLLASFDDNGNGTHRYLHMCLDLLNAEVNRLKKERDELRAEVDRLNALTEEAMK